MRRKRMNSALIGGVLSGIAGLFVFLTIHHFWIKPIWFILPPAFFIAVLGGLAVGWAYAEIRIGLPPCPWTAPVLFLLVMVSLTPAIVIAQLSPPSVDMATGTIIDGSDGSALILRFVFELLLTAALIGGLSGWWLARTPRAAFAMAIASLVFAIGPGHNIPFLGNTPAAGKGILLLIAITLSSAFVLVESQIWLSRLDLN